MTQKGPQIDFWKGHMSQLPKIPNILDKKRAWDGKCRRNELTSCDSQVSLYSPISGRMGGVHSRSIGAFNERTGKEEVRMRERAALAGLTHSCKQKEVRPSSFSGSMRWAIGERKTRDTQEAIPIRSCWSWLDIHILYYRNGERRKSERVEVAKLIGAHTS